ncbi:MAG: phage/plasmid primase, P4 family, partial [Xenococcaceae cyanobacterium]
MKTTVIPTECTVKLSAQHHQQCCGTDINKKQRGLDPEWVEANCYSVDIKEATELLGYPAKCGGIAIEGSNGQFQLRPDKPWGGKPGQKAPKYRTACRDEYTALLPKHPTDKNYWIDIEALKQRCYSINGHPYLVVTEGGFKAISLCSHGIPTIALLGVEMGLTPSSDDPQGKRYLVPDLERFAVAGFGFILAFDCDTYTKKPVKQALIKLARQLQKFSVPVYNLPEWNEEDGKGVDDYLQNRGIEEFRKELLSQAYCFEEWEAKYGSDAFYTSGGYKIPKPDIVGLEIAEKYEEKWVYCDELKSWLAYSLETEGIWTIVSKQYLAAEVHGILKARNIEGYGTNTYINNILGALERELYLRKWKEKTSTEWLPFQNGVLELSTGKLHEHSPEFRFTWQLPRDYTIVESGWKAIDNWLTEATQGNAEYKELLICFAAAVLRGRNDLQKFLHLIGGGGSGKSTFTTLLTALIGSENTATLNMSDLEDKHEIARIFGKRLIVLPDQDKAAKKMSNFKRLTGQDRLSGRRLFENGFEFIFGGLTVVTSNFPIFHTNVGSWLTRRVKMIPFNYQVPAQKKRDLSKDMTPELGAFTSYLLSIPSEKIERVLKGVSDRPLDPTMWEAQIRSDGMAAWVNDWVVQDCTAITRIGSNKSEWSSETEYDGSRSSLYGSYALYCQQTNRSAKSPQNFSAELLELCTRILGWQVEKDRVKMAGQTVRVIKGLRLRSLLDGDRPTVEEILEGSGERGETERGEGRKEIPSVTSSLFTASSSGDRGGDNISDNCGDKVKTLVDKGIDKGDNQEQFNKSEKINLSSPEKNKPTNVTGGEEKRNIPPLNLTKVENKAVNSVTPKAIDISSYPYDSSSARSKKERADQVKAKILGCSTSNELIELKISEREIDWLKKNVLTQAEREQLKQ